MQQRDFEVSSVPYPIMAKSETENQQPPPPPPPGYPTGTDNPTTEKSKKKGLFHPQTKKKGDRGFIEGCLFALCCCWLCEACF
ncbi:cysteine-rich and transmembrane domain-containing protein A [Melia azedarach]|uniref:Cysteine-rich and transmembrane domain-containing protein A n=1 Tax=Melia azedarach TaxID=155640 RepID=A0ACC1X598_MELAZ|nr:cysteine-rich and transmembrane domain-containing protein A [Melia azedarach]